jgi:hypothetical protein
MQKEIDDILKLGFYHVFYRGKEIKEIKARTPKQLKDLIKSNVEPSTKSKKVIIVRLKYENKCLFISCTQMTITPDLYLIDGKDDLMITVRYSNEDLDVHGFNMDDLKKITKALKNRTVNFSKSIIDVEDILNN